MESAKTLCISPSELKLKRGADVTHRLDLDIFLIKKRNAKEKAESKTGNRDTESLTGNEKWTGVVSGYVNMFLNH